MIGGRADARARGGGEIGGGDPERCAATSPSTVVDALSTKLDSALGDRRPRGDRRGASQDRLADELVRMLAAHGGARAHAGALGPDAPDATAGELRGGGEENTLTIGAIRRRLEAAEPRFSRWLMRHRLSLARRYGGGLRAPQLRQLVAQYRTRALQNTVCSVLARATSHGGGAS